MAKTISVKEDDYTKFLTAKIGRMQLKGKQITNPDFFGEVVTYWIEGNHANKTKSAGRFY